MNYDELEKMKPADYLSPEKFSTRYDKDDENSKEQYRKGLKIGSEMKKILINDRSVWLAGDSASTGVMSSSEGIGYHKDTASLLRGFLDSGAEIEVSRYDEKNGRTSTIIQKGDPEVMENIQEKILARFKKKLVSHKIYGLEPLQGRPLDSQISFDLDLPISYGDLEWDEKTHSYSGSRHGHDFIFVLSNHDISDRNTIRKIQNTETPKVKIEESANVILFRKNSRDDFPKTKSDTIIIDNKKITMYPRGKGHHEDQQYVYCEIVRDNEIKKNVKKNKNTP